MVCVSFYVICTVERLVSSVICRFQGLSYSHVPEYIEFSFILFIHHNIHFYFELCTFVTFWIFIYHEIWILLNIFLYGTIELFILWHVWRYSGVLWVNSCPPSTRLHQAVMHEWALLHHWLCNQKHPWGICSCSPIVNFLKVTFYHGMVTLVIFLIKQGKSEVFESCDRPIVRKRPIWVKIGDVLSCVTLKFDGWPWKTIGHLFFAVSSFVQHFIAISEFKLELQSGNAQFGSKSTIFRAV